MGQKQVKSLKREDRSGGAAVKEVASSAKAFFEDQLTSINQARPARKMSATAQRSARFTAYGILASNGPRDGNGNPIVSEKHKAIHDRLVEELEIWMAHPIDDSDAGIVQLLPSLSTPSRLCRRDEVVPPVARNLDDGATDEDDDDDDNDEVEDEDM
eukprot:Plantae.Rhodophyta-Palmaria_palmata.ctg1761.p3 GENE.Plantae.Rhodophyta-Palmaria_palmata.ctg1761~~Plantae.Rhodophyta-Palmaria_palmata.ctg1761.p3  ORF type:complete len:157 (+),score=35.02 Plantae.Rhodophyta-Palmaria_palmata.ctg1761:529-999(+)